MKDTYFEHIDGDPPGLSSVDIIALKSSPGSYIVARVCSSPSARRKGAAGRVLRQVLADADREGVALYLVISANRRDDKDLSNSALVDWYGRLGFIRSGDNVSWCRRPKIN